MNLPPGTRVTERFKGWTGTVIKDELAPDHPGMIPVRWDNGWHAFMNPESITTTGPTTEQDPQT